MKVLDTSKEPKMTEVAPMYIYATEMVGPYYKGVNLKGRRVLTIAGSGDQVANAFFYGASEVVGFDINRNALFMTELKLAAIRTLSYTEFLKYFSQTKSGFNKTLYEKVRPLLSKPCQKYFDQLYVEIGSTGLGVSAYFRHRGDLINRKKAQEINAYLNSATTYKKMREILEGARPILRIANVLKLADEKSHIGKFDIINLSNVPNYLTGRSFGLNELQVLSYFRKLKRLLTKDGAIFFYSYDDKTYPTPVSKDIPPISRQSFFKKIKEIGAFTVSKKSFPGLHDGYRDRITLLGC